MKKNLCHRLELPFALVIIGNPHALVESGRGVVSNSATLKYGFSVLRYIMLIDDLLNEGSIILPV